MQPVNDNIQGPGGLPDDLSRILSQPWWDEGRETLETFFREALGSGISTADAAGAAVSYRHGRERAGWGFCREGFLCFTYGLPSSPDYFQVNSSYASMFFSIPDGGYKYLSGILGSDGFIPSMLEEVYGFLEGLGPDNMACALSGISAGLQDHYLLPDILDACLSVLLGKDSLSPDGFAGRCREIFRAMEDDVFGPFEAFASGVRERDKGEWSTVFAPGLEEKFREGLSAAGVESGLFTLSRKVFAHASWSYGSNRMVFCFRRGTTVRFLNGVCRLTTPALEEMQVNIFSNGDVSRGMFLRGGLKLIPLKVKDIAGFADPGNMAFREFVDVLLGRIPDAVACDIRKFLDGLDGGLFLPGIQFMEAAHASSLMGLAAEKYGMGPDTPLEELNLRYACHRVRPYCDQASREALDSFHDLTFLARAGFTNSMSFRGRACSGVTAFLVQWYKDRGVILAPDEVKAYSSGMKKQGRSISLLEVSREAVLGSMETQAGE